MTTINCLKQELQKRTAKKVDIKEYFRSEDFLRKITEATNDKNLSKTIVSNYLSSFLQNPNLQATTVQSQILCLVKVATLKLIPNTPLGYAYIIPYGNTATLQLGYQGLVELCRRAGVKVFAQEVYEGDEFEFLIENGEKKIRHVLTQQGKVIKIYAGWRKGDMYDVVVWDIEKIIKHAMKYSKTFNNPDSAWKNVVDANVCPVNIWMAKKTVLIDALKLAPKTLELAEAIEEDIKNDLAKEQPSENNINIANIYENIEIEETINERKEREDGNDN